MTKTYSRPPLKEAILDFRFLPGDPWDLTVPGLVYERISQVFPKKQMRTGFQIQVRPGSTIEPILPHSETMQFRTADDSAMLQVGRHQLSYHALAPYPGWEAFLARCLSQLAIYRAVAAPSGFARIGMRYVNLIQVDSPTIALNDYFHFFPSVPEIAEPAPLANIDMKVLTSFSDPGMVMRASLVSSASDREQGAAFVFDLDAFTPPGAVPDFEDLNAWLATAHRRIEAFFEASFTERTHSEVFHETAGGPS